MNINPTAAIVRILQNIASYPRVYDVTQTLAGQQKNLQRIAPHAAAIRLGTVIDIGGGTGASRNLWPANCRYICLDIEMPKLRAFRSEHPNGLALFSDATRMAIANESADVAMCMAVVHHLTDTMLDQLFAEVTRILKKGGKIFLLDPVLNHDRWMGRVLWRLDRGSYPRSAEDLRNRLTRHFDLMHWEQFAIYHEYVFGIAVRR